VNARWHYLLRHGLQSSYFTTTHNILQNIYMAKLSNRFHMITKYMCLINNVTKIYIPHLGEDVEMMLIQHGMKELKSLKKVKYIEIGTFLRFANASLQDLLSINAVDANNNPNPRGLTLQIRPPNQRYSLINDYIPKIRTTLSRFLYTSFNVNVKFVTKRNPFHHHFYDKYLFTRSLKAITIQIKSVDTIKHIISITPYLESERSVRELNMIFTDDDVYNDTLLNGKTSLEVMKVLQTPQSKFTASSARFEMTDLYKRYSQIKIFKEIGDDTDECTLFKRIC